jgi:hypothetical protein
MKFTSVFSKNAWALNAWSWNAWSWLAAMACIMASSGCTSVISSAYLREAWLDAVEHAAESRADAKRNDKEAAPDAGDAEDADTTADGFAVGDAKADSDVAAWSPATLEEAVDEAERRLAQSGGLNAAARGTLTAMLKSTPQQDWPVVVEEFASALAAAHVGSGAEPVGVAAAKDASPIAPEEGIATTATEREAVILAAEAEPVAPMPPAESPQAAAPEPDQKATHPAPAQPVFAVQNACFASRVRAWGVVDRFETAQFQPGQELIVYFELDQLASRESADGHTTRIDTVLRLVDAGGRRLHEWTFEPLEETCGGHRRDYFARYLVALPPATPAGSCRLEVVVTDTIAGRTAQTGLPLEIVDR